MMDVFTLYIGTKQAGAKETLLGILRERFASFTVIAGEGYFRGVPEPMWFVRLATNDAPAVISAAQAIRSALNQDAVGIEHQSRYYRCTETDPATELISHFR